MKSLKYILCLFALVAMFTSCTKDADLLAPVQEWNNTEKKCSDTGSDNPDKPTGENSDAAGMASGSGSTGDQSGNPDATGISDDDDDESDDDASNRVKK